MKAIYKEPGKKPEIIDVGNSLEALQFMVRGYIESVTLAADACVLCNEEGRMRKMPYNCHIGGVSFVGPILIVGTKEDEFCDVPDVRFYVRQITERRWDA